MNARDNLRHAILDELEREFPEARVEDLQSADRILDLIYRHFYDYPGDNQQRFRAIFEGVEA